MNNNLRVFIGGTGRCGTTILGKTLENIESCIYFVEPRMIVPQSGIYSLLEGNLKKEQFLKNLKSIFIPRIISSFKSTKEHCKVYDVRDDFYKGSFISTIISMAEKAQTPDTYFEFLRLFIEYALIYFESSSFIYKTPNLIYCVGLLQQLYPSSHFFHIIREPKDIYESVLAMNHNIKNEFMFSKWYNMKMKRALQIYREIDQVRYHVVNFEKLVLHTKYYVSNILNTVNSYKNSTLNDCVSSIDTKSSHIGRHRDNLSNKHKRHEYRYIDSECSKIYETWLELAI